MFIAHITHIYRQFGKYLPSFVAAILFSLFANSVALALTSENHTNAIAEASTPPVSVQKDVLVVGSEQDFPPLSTGMTDLSAGGFTVELWKAVAKEAGFKYTIRVMPFNKLLQEFKEGKIDVLLNLAISKERHQFADFTVPHAIIHGGIFVRKDETHINSEADLTGKSIIVLNSDLAHDYALSKGWKQQLILVDNLAEGMRLLDSGKHDALLTGDMVGMQTIKALGLSNLKLLKAKAGFSQKFAFALHEGNSELFSKINEAIDQTKENGTYDKLFDKWIDVGETKEIKFLDLLKYLLPIAFVFLSIAFYHFYLRKIERTAAQKALQESEKHLRLSQTCGGIGTWEANLLDNTQKWSENCIAILGFPALSKPTWEDFLAVIHPEDRQRVIDATQSHIEHGTKYDVEYRITTTDGLPRWIRSAGQIEQDENGKPAFMRGIAQDITDRKFTELALAQNEQKHFEILENVDSCIFVKDLQGRYLFANRKVRELFGASMEGVVGKADEQFFDAETSQLIRENDRRVLEKGEILKTVESNLKFTDGYVSTYLVVKIPLRKATGEVYALCGISTEITELKQVEAQLTKSVSLLNATLEATNDALLVVDLNNTWVSYNKRLLEMWSIPEEAILSKNDNAALSAVLNQLEDPETFLNKVHELYAAPEVNSFDTLKFKDGRIIERYSIPQTLEGKVVGRVWSFRDVTERKLAEVKLIESKTYAHSIIESSPVPLALNDDFGNITYLNSAFLNKLGYTLSDIPTLADWWPLAYPDPQYRQSVIETWQNNLQQSLISGSPLVPMEVNIRCKDNTIRTFICSVTDIHNSFADTHIVVLYDITERKLAEEKLQYSLTETEQQNIEMRRMQTALVESRDRYLDLYEFAPVGYLAINKHGMISEVNWKLTAMLGLKRNQLNQHRFEEFVIDEDKGRWHRLFKHMKGLAGGEDLNFDLKFSHTNGDLLTLNINCMRIDDETLDGEIASTELPILRVAILDVTELKQAEAKLIHSEAYLQNIINNEPECIKVVDARGYLKQMNPAGLAMIEADSLEQASSVPLLNFIVPEHQQAFIDLHKRVLAGESAQLEFETIGLKGGRRWLDTHAVPMLENGKNVLLSVTRDITERKLSEQRLEKLAFEQNAMLDNKIVGISKARNRKIVWANAAYETMFGYSKEELIDMPTRRLYANEEDYEAIGAAYIESSDGTILRRQFQFVRKDGEHIWVNISGTVLNKDTGESLWALIDVTEQKLAELAVHESHNFLQAVIDTAPIRIFWKDKDLRYLGCNPAFAQDNGITSPKEIVGKDDYQMVWADQAEKYRADDLAVMQSGIAKLGYDEIQTTTDGQVIWLRTSKVPLLNSNNEITGVLGIYENITESKLVENDQRIAAIAFESQEGMLVTDANANIIKVNRAFSSITGFSSEEVLGKNPHLLSSGQHSKAFYTELWHSVDSTGAWQGEIWNKRKNGDVYPEHLTITAVKNSNGDTTNYVATLTDITMSKAAAEEIQHLAFYDPLTRLPNRRLLVDRLNQALVASARNGSGGAILFLDLDHFKTLNDTLGHEVGDLLLQQVANRLCACVREGDTVARLGGDEYVVMLEHLNEQTIEAAAQAEVVGEKILSTLNQPYKLADHEYHSTPSIGVALFGNEVQSQEELLKHADIAMYQAKKAGRNTLRFYDPEMQTAIHNRVSLESDLRKALELQQFHLYYQIQVDSMLRPTGAEALIRWIHPQRGLVSPFQFIPLAEETGLILSIGQWVLENACAQVKAWEENIQTRELTLSINVSAKQFRQADFAAQVKNAIHYHGINPRLLKLELTESVLLDNIDETILTMNALKEIGIHFSLDDFGTGYSSLQYLRRLPLNQLKIDQSFVRDILTDSSGQAIVRTIIAMAESLELDVIAEGVETEQQQQLLLKKGCMNYQGFLFGKPVPIEQFEAALKIST